MWSKKALKNGTGSSTEIKVVLERERERGVCLVNIGEHNLKKKRV